jgi:hypothetical protein
MAVIYLLGLLVIVGIFAAQGMERLLQASRFQKDVQLQAETAIAKKYIESRLSCEATFNAELNAGFSASSCAGEPVRVLGYGGDPSTPITLVSDDEASPTRLGALTLRALCSTDPANPGFIIQAAKLAGTTAHPLTSTNAADFKKISRTSRVVDWQHPLAVSPSLPRLCAKQFRGVRRCTAHDDCVVHFNTPYATNCPQDRVLVLISVRNFGTATAKVRISGGLTPTGGNGGCSVSHASLGLTAGVMYAPFGVEAVYGAATILSGNEASIPPSSSVVFAAGGSPGGGIGIVSGTLSVIGDVDKLAASGTGSIAMDSSTGSYSAMISNFSFPLLTSLSP